MTKWENDNMGKPTTWNNYKMETRHNGSTPKLIKQKKKKGGYNILNKQNGKTTHWREKKRQRGKMTKWKMTRWKNDTLENYKMGK